MCSSSTVLASGLLFTFCLGILSSLLDCSMISRMCWTSFSRFAALYISSNAVLLPPSAGRHHYSLHQTLSALPGRGNDVIITA